MTTYTEHRRSAEARARPILGEVCATIADVQVRNRGTIGGNVCSNDPTNHLPPLMVAVGARMTIAGADGEREVPAEDFFLGVYMTAVGPGELLTRISIPAGQAGRLRRGHARRATGRASPTRPPRVNGARPRRARLRRRGAACVRHGRLARRRRRDAGARGERSSRRPTSTPPASTARTSPRSLADARRAGGGGAARWTIAVNVNGTTYERDVEPRQLLIHFLRDDLDLTGSHIGCDTGNCGACSVIVRRHAR